MSARPTLCRWCRQAIEYSYPFGWATVLGGWLRCGRKQKKHEPRVSLGSAS